ncbi:unnamed protein product [Gadus morhua 'NCC']
MDALSGEWQSLKTLVSHTFKDKSYSSLWQTVSTKEPYRTDYKCERGFSAQKRLKSSLRSCLHVSTTEDLIRITTEGPSLELFDPTKCAEHWLSAGKWSRRPNYKSWPSDSEPVMIFV